ncbi:MAG: galactose mutarotase [Bacilli bacterium]|nr:galactose mutarotase [Bacilli bacterium]
MMAIITRKDFGYTSKREKVSLFEMVNAKNMKLRVLDYGCAMQSLIVKDKNGEEKDVILGYDDLHSYEIGSCLYGAVVGRYANRIKEAHFFLEGKEYQLEKNSPNGHNHIHGVFPHRVFEARIEDGTLLFHYLSPAYEEGFPGNFDLYVRYSFLDDGSIVLEYEATSDQTTPVNLTNHCYFNLNGADGDTVLDHVVKLNATAYTEYSETFAPTGRIISVDGTPLDFSKEHTIGERFLSSYHQFRICTGYDHNMVLDGKDGELKPIGTARSNKTGIKLEAYTTEPAIQFYSANFIHFDEAKCGKNGIRYPKNGGLCMEAQHYPDSLNNPHFPSTVLEKGKTYRQKTIYRVIEGK